MKDLIKRLEYLESQIEEVEPVNMIVIREQLGKWHYWDFTNYSTGPFPSYTLVTEEEAYQIKLNAESKGIKVVFEVLGGKLAAPRFYQDQPKRIHSIMFMVLLDQFAPRSKAD